MDNVEHWANAIETSIIGVSVPETIQDGDKCLTAIVEPFNQSAEYGEVEEEYDNWVNENTDQWVGWISSTFGSDWGRVAQHVAENGY